MTIAIIGAGGIGQALARRFVSAGEHVQIANSRGPETLASLAASLGPKLEPVTVPQAAASSVVVIAVPWPAIARAAADSGVTDWHGKVIVDTTNPLAPPDFVVADLGGRTSSEVVTDHFPGARLVKAFNTLSPAVVGADPRTATGRRVIFMSGNDADATAVVSRLAEKAGWFPLDLGRLDEGGRLQQFPGGPLATRDLILNA